MTPKPQHSRRHPVIDVTQHHRYEALCHLLDFYMPRHCVEVGSQRGASAAIIGQHIRPLVGTLLCVDIWENNGEYDHFCQTMWDFDLQEIVTPLQMRSVDAAKTDLAKGPFDFLYVDAEHTQEAVWDDLVAWAPRLRPGAIMAGDDYGMAGVRAAWDAFASLHNMLLTNNNQVVSAILPCRCFCRTTS